MVDKRTRKITSVELTEQMLIELDRLATKLHLKRSDLIRWGIDFILSHPPMVEEVKEYGGGNN